MRRNHDIPGDGPSDLEAGSSSRSSAARTRRRGLSLLVICLTSIGIGQSMLFSILPPAAREIGISPFQVSTIFAATATAWVIFSPMWGRRSDRRGRRGVIFIGLMGYAISMILLASVIEAGIHQWLSAAVVYPLMVGSRVLFAVLGSGTAPASQAYIADRTDRTERVAGIALITSAMGIGETAGPGVGALLVGIDLLAPIYFAAALAALSAFAIWAFLPEDAPPERVDPEKPPRMRVTDRRILPFLVFNVLLQAVRTTTIIVLAFFLQDTLALDPTETVRVSSVGLVIVAVAGLSAQLGIVHRLSPPPRTLMRIGALVLGAAFPPFVLGHTIWAFYFGLACLGIGLGLVRPGSVAAASLAVGPNEQGAVAGILSVALLGSVVAPMLATALYPYARTGPFLLNGAMVLGMLWIAFGNRRVRSARA